MTDNFAPENNETPTIENFKEVLVGPGKKYETEEDALKGLYHSQQHIQKLETEAAERKAKMEESKVLEDVLAAIDARNKEQPAITPPVQGLTPQGTIPVPQEPEPEVNMEEAVLKVIEQQREQESYERNYNSALETLDNRFGSRRAVNEAVEKRAKELGVGINFFKETARKTPKAFLELMGTSSKQTSAGVTPTPLNTTAVVQKNLSEIAQPGTYRYYQKLRKEDPRQYKAQYQTMMKMLDADPDAFYERT